MPCEFAWGGKVGSTSRHWILSRASDGMAGVLVTAGVGEGGTTVGVAGRVSIVVGAAIVVGDGDGASGVTVALRKGLFCVGNPLQPANKATMISITGVTNGFMVGLLAHEERISNNYTALPNTQGSFPK